LDICSIEFEFSHFEEVSSLFKKLINAMKQMNYSEFKSEEFRKHESEVDILLSEFRENAETLA
jgi:V/A-type H+-transporting ATPase subunit A